jgi:signal peptidase I
VGLPGDRIQMKEGQFFINDQKVARKRLEDADRAAACAIDRDSKVMRWRETLPNGVSYDTLDCVDSGFYNNTNIYVVPPDHIFVLGDNRDNALDRSLSSVLAATGYVPLENVVGRVGMIYFSVTAKGDVRSERIGKVVR